MPPKMVRYHGQRWLTALLILATTACSNPFSNVLLQDDFATQNHNWFVAGDETGTLDYENGAYVFKVKDPNLFVWGNPGLNQFSNLHVEVTAITSQAQDAAFGLICNYQDENNFYYLGLTPKGYYAIIKFADEDHFLTGENTWASSAQITQTASTYRLGADCGADGRLALYVDGQTIATANDTTYTQGNVGLFIWTFDTVPVEVQFDDFIATRLPEP